MPIPAIFERLPIGGAQVPERTAQAARMDSKLLVEQVLMFF